MVAAQGVSSISNIVLAILIARSATVAEFAAFALVTPLWIVMQRFMRVYLLIPRQIELHHPDEHPDARPPANACLAVALAFTIVLLAVTPLFGADSRPWLAVMALSLPGLALYDCVRTEYVAHQAVERVLALDLGWLVGQLVASAVVIALDANHLFHLVGWAAAPAAIAVTVWLVRWRGLRPSLRAGARQALAVRDRLADTVTDVLSTVLIVQAVPYVVAILSGSLAAVAALRAGQTLLGPINIVVLGLMPLLQMAVARRARDRRQVVWVVHVCNAGILALCVAYGAVLVAIPDSIGEQLFGDTWKYAALMLLPLAFHRVGRTPFALVTGAMRALGMRRSLVVQRLASAVLLVVAVAVATLTYDDIAAIAWAMCAAATFSSVALYVSFRWQLARR